MTDYRKEYKKSYLWSNFLSPIDAVHQRIKRIKFLSEKLPNIPNTRFELKNNTLEYYQEFICKPESVQLSDSKKISLLEDFIHTLQGIEDEGFVHGDINYKNIISGNDRLWLIDLEPDLHQLKNGQKQMLCTIPYIAIDDILNRSISINTDKIGWFFFANRMLHDKKISMPLRWHKHKLEVTAKSKYLDDIITKLSFREILENVINNNTDIEKQIQISWRKNIIQTNLITI